MNPARPPGGHGSGRSVSDPGEDGAPWWAELLAAVDAEASVVDVAVRIDDGAGRRTRGRLVIARGDPDLGAGGRVLRLSVDRPEVAVAAMPAGVLGRRHTRRAPLEQLRGSGWRAELRGPGGLVAAVDPDRPRRLARLLSGSPYLHLTPAAALAASSRTQVVAATSAVAGLLGTALLVGVVARRRRR